jgi:indole-3-glycerol phosphate synthase
MEGTILEGIIERKRLEVKDLKLFKLDLTELNFKPRSLIEKLRSTDEVAIISEFKRASPSKGDINLQLKPVEQARLYVKAGASAISVLTDEIGFKGTFSDLKKVREAVDIPILCKDFIIDRVQIDLARYSGADVILLIAAALSKDELALLHSYASTLGLECLVEIHDEQDLEKAIEIKAPLIGINNRDLKTFQVNLETSMKLGPLVKKSGALLISESGMKTRGDVQTAALAGANGVLVGETFMKSFDVEQTFLEFKVPIGGY